MRGRRPYIISIIFLVLLVSSLNARPTKKEKFEALSAEILRSLQSFYPVLATEKGIHEYDYRLADYSKKSVGRMTKKLDKFEKSLYKFRLSFSDAATKIDYKLIKSNTDIALLNLKRIKWHTRAPQMYVEEAVNGIYFLMLSEHAPLSKRLISVLGRMKQVPGLFATARKNIKKPPPIYIELARESLQPASEFYRQVASELMKTFPERADEILMVSTAAREAMNDFEQFLEDVTPGTSTSFAIGTTNYDYKLAHEYFFGFDSDSLLQIGENLLNQARQEYSSYQANVESNHQNGKDSIFVPTSFSRQDLLDYYTWETQQVRLFVAEHDILSIPDDLAPLTVVETPPFLRPMIAGIAYQPAGPFDSVQRGYFYIRPVPEDLSERQLAGRFRFVQRRGFKGSTVHEAFPGHHLQMQIAGQHTSDVRKWQSNTMMVEGWALYSEEMMYQVGLYGQEDPAMWLAILGGIRFRAARIIADVKLQTGQFSYQQCVDWMIDVLEASSESEKEYLRKSVRKYTYTPGIWMSYLMGKREITLLRDAMMARQGESFTLKSFHDTLLSEGSIPPALLWQALGLDSGK